MVRVEKGLMRQILSTRNLRARMKRLMGVSEAREICKDSTHLGSKLTPEAQRNRVVSYVFILFYRRANRPRLIKPVHSNTFFGGIKMAAECEVKWRPTCCSSAPTRYPARFDSPVELGFRLLGKAIVSAFFHSRLGILLQMAFSFFMTTIKAGSLYLNY
ncbi:hypothetical protein EVAR_90756_1 [Eumeta japonica]|uniref:Uncharacterized protein n=1 Tax=Eumeta variegata TaxID=151549 RepID=A0A4C1ZDA3_EUMVA|nr:hypothetical protein EVAR_90756_1 [Eumeta japonica]